MYNELIVTPFPHHPVSTEGHEGREIWNKIKVGKKVGSGGRIFKIWF